ncbi:MAG: hypothetical protein LUB59_03510 [Candidatus Gastranaerophilales bacterium]|nr:hypothetical protein [Candidatus Gastranaerophilales bacterium]
MRINSTINYSNNVIKQSQNQQKTCNSALYSNQNSNIAVSFCAAVTAVQLRTPYMKKTYNTVKETYNIYKENLNELTIKDIHKSVENITANTKFTREEVLEAMQHLTQFASLRSVKKIGQVLNQHDISLLGDTYKSISFWSKNKQIKKMGTPGDAGFNDTGLHKSLDYLLNKKNISVLNFYKSDNVAIFLDENKISQMENLQKNNPALFNEFIHTPRFKFFTISGWDNGITFADRNVNLEEKTVELLKTARDKNISIKAAIDKPINDRIDKLGIIPITIKNEGLANETCVYKQLAPEKMTENEFFNIIDANSIVHSKGNTTEDILNKSIAAEYVRNNMRVYTSEKLSKSLVKMHEKFVEYAAERQKTPDDIIYIMPDETKSYVFVNYCYQRVNKVPQERFKTVSDIKRDKSCVKDKLVVFLDDSILSGDSLSSIMLFDIVKSLLKNSSGTVFSYICGSETAIKKYGRNKSYDLIVLDKVKGTLRNSKNHGESPLLEKVIGPNGYDRSESFCLMFPYMSPDNNSQLASNIAMLHNINYRCSNTMREYELCMSGVKAINKDTTRVERVFHSLTGSKPVVSTDEKINSMIAAPEEQKEKSFFDKIKSFLGL